MGEQCWRDLFWGLVFLGNVCVLESSVGVCLLVGSAGCCVVVLGGIGLVGLLRVLVGECGRFCLRVSFKKDGEMGGYIDGGIVVGFKYGV